ncbi:MAG: sulfatase [Flavisolibacter sp.]
MKKIKKIGLLFITLIAINIVRLNAQSKQPNIIIIFADDLGYGDLGCYGHPTILTPNLDKMAKEGMRFTQFYVGAAVCTPSRAALLTGRLGVRTGIYGKRDVFFPNSASGLPPKEITIAEMLKTKGYATGIIGKWHLGHLPEYLPIHQGFDYWFGIPYSNDMGKIGTTHPNPDNPNATAPRSNAVPLPLYRNDKVIEFEPDQHYLTQRYTEEAISFIKKNKEKNKPFFLYYASNFPHIPLYASPKFEGKSKRGLYGDVVAELDWSAGEVINTLKKLKIEKNTLVIFTSDNGPWLTQLDHGGSAGILYEGKNSTYEGGMREPAIAWWPGKIKANIVSSALVNAMDLLPTFAKLSGTDLPKDRVLDGMDISDLLFGRKDKVRNIIYYYINANLYAVRKGTWKAHFITHRSYSMEAPVPQDPPLLYNIEVDPSEKYNVAKQHPDIIEDLRKEYEKQKAIIAAPAEMDKIIQPATGVK